MVKFGVYSDNIIMCPVSWLRYAYSLVDDEDDDEEFEQGTNKNFGASTRMKSLFLIGVYSYVIFCTLVHVLTMFFF